MGLNFENDLVYSFLDSMKMDLEKKEYDTIEEYKKYIYGSADVVGLMCLKVFVDGSEETYNELSPFAISLGSAFQKVNFLRDISEDYQDKGRSYFPNLDLNKKLNEKFNGNVINMLDAKIFGLNPDHYTYTLSKFALLGLTKVASLSYAPKLRVNGIAPGFTLPNPEHGAKDFKRIQKLNPLLKGPNPSDVINAVKFLIKTLSITGENILIDGGAHLSPQKRDATFL